MLKSIFNRIKRIVKNNFDLVPNLLKGDYEVKLYVIRVWFFNNISLVNPFHTRFQELILKIRNNSNKSSMIKSLTLSIDDLINNLDIYYINLEHRADRREEVEIEFNQLGLHNYKRFNAVRNINGALGCALSHRAVLETWASKTENLLMVCEDDISFLGDLKSLKDLLIQFKEDDRLDVMCLAYNHFNQVKYNGIFFQTSDCQTVSCYVLKPYMRDIMIDNFSLSIKLLEAGVYNQYKVTIDQVWKVLQKDYNFVIPKKRFAIQRESFSDIEQKVVDYKV